MIFKLSRLTGLIVIIFGVCACTSTTLKKSDYGSLHAIEDVARYTTDTIQQEIANGNIRGVSVALVDKAGVVWSKSFGQVSMESDIQLSSRTPLPIASVTKVFTAIAIQQLAERGEIDLDATLSFYIPELEISHFSEKQPSVRDLLSHYSGIPSNQWAGYRYSSDEVPTLSDWSFSLENLPDQVSPLRLVSTPGEAMIYSNLGYSLLGLIVQRVSGMTYTDYVQTNILQKTGMEDSEFLLDSNMQKLLRDQYKVMERIDHPVVRDLPAGGLMASAKDLSVFLTALLNQTEGMLSPSAWQDMYSVQHENANTHGDTRMGLGVFLSPPGVPLGSVSSRLPLSVSHSGDMGQYHSEMIVLPEEGLGVLVLAVSDKNRLSTDRIADAALSALYELRIGTLPEASSASSNIQSLHSAQPKKLAGYYASELGLIKIEEKRGNLRMKVGRIGFVKFDLKSQEDGQTFSLNPKLFGFIPLPNFLLNLKDMTIVSEYGGESPRAWLALKGFRIMALTPVKETPIPDIWLDSIGEYQVSDPTGSVPHIEYFSIQRDSDSGLATVAMRARGKKKIELVLTIISNELAVIAGYGRDLGTTIRRHSNGKIYYSGLVVEKKSAH